MLKRYFQIETSSEIVKIEQGMLDLCQVDVECKVQTNDHCETSYDN